MSVKIAVALARFMGYLAGNIGKPIGVGTIAAFNAMSTDITDELNSKGDGA